MKDAQCQRPIVRLESVWNGRDRELLDAMFAFYAPHAQRIVDVCCNARRMWGRWALNAVGYDIDPAVRPDEICGWHALPDADRTVDVVVYDPPHLPLAAASARSLAPFVKGYGLARSIRADNVAELHTPMLREAHRVLRADGLIFAKIKDYVHNHRYQWNLELFNTKVRAVGLTPCDIIVKRDPAAGNLKSGRWRRAYHVRNVHCFWVVVRKGRCEPRDLPLLDQEILGGDAR